MREHERVIARIEDLFGTTEQGGRTRWRIGNRMALVVGDVQADELGLVDRAAAGAAQPQSDIPLVRAEQVDGESPLPANCGLDGVQAIRIYGDARIAERHLAEVA